MKDADFPAKGPKVQSHEQENKPVHDCHCTHCAKKRSKFI